MNPILPGKTIGILGGGQLGRMLSFEAKRMGYKVITLDPDPDSPCGQVSDDQIIARFDDTDAMMHLGERCDVVTYEFENINHFSVEALEQKGKRVCPNSAVLRTTQNRLLEKEFLTRMRIPVTQFMEVNSTTSLREASETIGFPAVLKTISHGYDGKGQWIVQTMAEAEYAFKEAKGFSLIWEKIIHFAKELGIICVRNEAGEIVTYPVTENIHKENILDLSIIPARISPDTAQRAKAIATSIAEALQFVGTFCVEMFLLPNGDVLVNEIAPRPHNSGHYTIDACVTSQFEQQLRAICNLPLGSSKLISRAVMANILGSGSGNTLTGIDALLKDSAAHLHLYGKKHAAAKRKMGHVTFLGDSVDALLEKAQAMREELAWI